MRDLKSGEAAKEAVLARAPKDAGLTIEVWSVDMASFKSVKAFAERCDTLNRVDGVAMNAGTLGGSEMTMTEDGNELV